MKSKILRLGKRKTLRIEGWISGYAQPSGRYWKRVASKKSRRAKVIASGGAYKKVFGPFELS